MDYADLDDFGSNGLLSDEVAAWEPGKLEAEAELAIDLLGFRPDSFSGDDLAVATRAVALQVNHHGALSSGEGFALSSERRGKRSRSFRSAGLRIVNPVAASLAYTLIGGRGWPTVNRLR